MPCGEHFSGPHYTLLCGSMDCALNNGGDNICLNGAMACIGIDGVGERCRGEPIDYRIIVSLHVFVHPRRRHDSKAAPSKPRLTITVLQLLPLLPTSRYSPRMDPPPSQGSPFSSVRQQLFHSSHLPPPSQLHLPPVTSSRSNINTLPPLNPSSRMSPYNHRHPSPPSSWPSSLHRTSSSRDDIPSSSPLHSQPVSHPPVLHHSVTRHAEPRQLKREQLAPPQPPPPKDGDDNMPATSDFVKKLYKYVFHQSLHHPAFTMRQDARGSVLLACCVVGSKWGLLRCKGEVMLNFFAAPPFLMLHFADFAPTRT